MRKLLMGIALFTFVFFACDDKKNTTDMVEIDNPLEELPWLKDVKESLISCTCDVSIFQAKYNNQTVFFTMMNDPLCNSVFGVTIWNVKGEVIKSYSYNDFNAFTREVTEKKNLYTCS